MGDWFRSQTMSYVTLIVSDDASKVIVRELGALGCIQFVDLQSKLTAFQRLYTPLLKRFDDIEKKIRFLADEVKKNGVTVAPMKSPEAFLGIQGADGMEGDGSSSSSNLGSASETDAMMSGLHIVESLEGKVTAFVDQMTELNRFKSSLSEEYLRKVEFQHLLVLSSNMSSKMKGGLDKHLSMREDSVSLLDGEENGNMGTNREIELSRIAVASGGGYDDEGEVGELSFSCLAGTIRLADRTRFERQLYRSTRGNCFMRFCGLDSKAIAKDHDLPELHLRVGFIIFFKSLTIERKIQRICDSFGCHQYSLPASRGGSARKQTENNEDMRESKIVLQSVRDKQVALSQEMRERLEGWLWVGKREKATYEVLNMCRRDGIGGSFLQAKGWIPDDMIASAHALIEKTHLKHNIPSSITLLERASGSWPDPPTYFRTNKYTYAYQEFVNTYGMPRYREVNPALFTAATFPFLFGVMYGDIGHGSCVTLGGLFLVLTANKALQDRGLDDMTRSIYAARYMLLAMGICAVYCGLIYNDFFSLTFDFFGSAYSFRNEQSDSRRLTTRILSDNSTSPASGSTTSDPEDGDVATLTAGYGNAGAVYPFGVDPMWHIAGNDLLFFNSMKMKMSVILGIVQMIFGILMKGVNARYFRLGLDFFLEFIPQLLFAVSLFGYIIVLIFLKWSIDWQERMQWGSCNYDENGVPGACELGAQNGAVTSCYSAVGSVCDADTPLDEKCPLDFGGSGDGCQPPNLITTLMNIALKPGVVDEPMYAGQAEMQVFLFLFAFACVPWMLCIKPYLLIKEHQNETHDAKHADHREKQSLVNRGATDNPLLAGPDDPQVAGRGIMDSYDEEDDLGGDGVGDDVDEHDEEHSAADIVIHQCIETIEFVLGIVSNTASYLRLWALSLAHSELAHVFWEKAMLGAINTENPVVILIGFYVFAMVTIGVLLCMDVLECFLHALRLHWVEFQNKFYKADGYRFRPLSFVELLRENTL